MTFQTTTQQHFAELATEDNLPFMQQIFELLKDEHGRPQLFVDMTGLSAACGGLHPQSIRRHIVGQGIVTPVKVGNRTVYSMIEFIVNMAKLPVGENAVFNDAAADSDSPNPLIRKVADR